MKIILGSSSKWRKQILEELGYRVEVVKPGIDEQTIRREDPKELTLALAQAKAEAIMNQLTEPAVVVTADTVVVWNGRVHEKPRDEQEARDMLHGYHQHPVEAITAVVATDSASGRRAEGVESTRFVYRQIPEETIETLIREGEVMFCSGALMAEHPLLMLSLENMEGTLDNAAGMPKELARRLIDEVK